MDVYKYLRNKIIQGEIPPGERLIESALADMLNVSRTPIRQAIHKLEFDGLVTPLTKGYMVTIFEPADIEQIYNLRVLLEGHAAYEAAIYRTEEDIETLHLTNDTFQQAVTQQILSPEIDLSLIVDSNRQFHQAINHASKNKYLKNQIDNVVILPLVYRSFYWYNDAELQRSADAHAIIIRAIEQQQPERARNAVQEHVYAAIDHIMINLMKGAPV